MRESCTVQHITILNPSLFRWNIQIFGNVHVIDGYAFHKNANLVAKEPFVTIVGRKRENLNSLLSALERVNTIPFESDKVDFYGTYGCLSTKAYNSMGITFSLPVIYEETSDVLIESSRGDPICEHCICAEPIMGYVQPIQSSWEYRLYKGSLLHINEESEDKNISSIVYMTLDTYHNLPPISSVMFEKDPESEETNVVKFTRQRFLDDSAKETREIVCPVSYMEKHPDLKTTIIKRKKIFPILK